MNHTTVYIESLCVCILFLCALFILNIKHGPPRHFPLLASIYCMTTLSALLDILWVLIDGLQEYAYLQYLTHPIYLSCFTLIGTVWVIYCSKSLPFQILKKRWQHMVLWALPTVIIVLNITSPFTGLMFYLDEEYHYCRGPLYYIQMVGYVYLVTAGILTLKARKDAQFYTERQHLSSLASFCVSPLLLGLFSVIAPPGGIPSMQFSILFSLFLIFVEDQAIKVTHDSLTGLYNRYSLDHSINDYINRYRKTGEPFYILMADLDHFKSINDTYGHMEGDRMLKVVADILDSIAKDHDSRASRMGGDEFAIVVSCRSFGAAHAIKEQIRNSLTEAGKREDRDLAVSIGIAEYKNQMSITQLLEIADQNLYLEKHNA